MVWRRLLIVISFGVLLATGIPQIALAETPKDKGLLISPIRQYVRVSAGKSQTGVVTVANLTDKPLTANLSAKQFSVTNYSYDYKFSPAQKDWLTFSTPAVSLKPNESRKVSYSLNPPSTSAPGGHYYTLFASADLGETGVASTVQAASLLYITVNGPLTKSHQVLHDSIERLAFGSEILYSLTVKNTGNVHYFTYVSGELHGLSARKPSTATTHLLMPDTERELSGLITTPVLPGIYRATYGFKTDSGVVVMQSHRVVVIPPWSIAALLLIGFGLVKFYHRKKR